MLKKILMLSASLLLATAATNATAGAVAVLPTYSLSPLTGSIKIIGSDPTFDKDGNENGGTKFFKETLGAKQLIRIAFGGDPDEAAPGTEKNYVLALAQPDSQESCSAEIVVWDKVAHTVKAELALLANPVCEEFEPVSTSPANGKNGSYQEYFTATFQFINPENTCGQLPNANVEDGGISALGSYSSKISGNGEIETPSSLSLSHMVGDIHPEEDSLIVITDGSFKATLTPTKNLNTQSVSTPIALTCAQ